MRRTWARSPRPQNWAEKIAAPLPTPNRNRDIRKKTCPASPTAATAVSPNWPTISTSTAFSAFMTNCWVAIGIASRSIVL